MTPLTPAGQALLNGLEYGGDRGPTREERRHYREAIVAIERQAADRALAELRREVVDGEPLNCDEAANLRAALAVKPVPVPLRDTRLYGDEKHPATPPEPKEDA